MTDLTAGFLFPMDLTVVNGAAPAVAATMIVEGERFLDFVAIGDRVWATSPLDEGWVEPGPGGGPRCGGAPCTFENTVGMIRVDPSRVGTFITVGEEDLDGIPAVHLRSTAGVERPMFGAIPGTTDLWIAKDAGHLLREVFDGSAIRSEILITHANDPANVVEWPR